MDRVAAETTLPRSSPVPGGCGGDNPAALYLLGRCPYEAAWRLQQRWLDARRADRRPDSVLLLEHDHVLTVGRRGVEAHWRHRWSEIAAAGIPVYQVDRGGSVTYHGPGQLVGYPIMRLRPPFPGPRAFVALLEEVILRTLADWRLPGFRRDGLPGVWVDGPEAPMKIAAVGVRIVRGVTMHGFALNVSPDLGPFDWIVPCGIEGCRVTSMSAWLNTSVSSEVVTVRLAAHLAEVFGLTWSVTHASPIDHLE